jgi:carbonic anhydrase
VGLPRRLIDGYEAFCSARLPRERERFKELADSGQRPEIMVIGCCDSRVSPEVIFDARPGELFVVRNVANLVPPFSPDGGLHGVSAALEFAVMALRVKHIVVLGHERCGGVAAAAHADAEPLSPGDFIGQWMSMLGPTIVKLGPPPMQDPGRTDYLRRLEHASVATSLDNLMTFPCVRILAERGKISLHGAYFGVATGILWALDREAGTFAKVGDGGRRAIGCVEVA